MHRTQKPTRGLCTSDKIYYWTNLWKSVPLYSSDCNSSKEHYIIGDIPMRDLLIEALIRGANDNNFSEISLNFLQLVDNIINKQSNKMNRKEKKKWLAFGRWLKMKEPLTAKQVKNHLKNKWKRLEHAYSFQNIEVLPKISEIVHFKSKNLNELKLNGFRHIIEPECIVNSNHETLVHLDNLNNDDVIIEATKAIDHYYFHTIKNPSHRSEGFWKNLVEHFGTYVSNSLLPFTSSDMASTHNIAHLECVHKLIYGIKPLSDSINQFVQNNYNSLYIKLTNLSWGPFGPKPFGIFPMIGINYNTISNYHIDANDEANCLCILVALGDFKGGELCFPQLKIVVSIKPGQVVAFRSRLLLHGNCIVTEGIRHSIVYYVHSNFFKKSTRFKKIYEDYKDNIERDDMGKVVDFIQEQELQNSKGLNNINYFLKPKKWQISEPSSSDDNRRNCINLSRARKGYKVEDPLEEV
jgi:hypothetical protein